jgi:predicted nucleic acid-binding protein
MTFAQIPAGAFVFVDTNTFIYAFDADPRYGAACKQLLQRIENQEIRGFTSAHVINEMAHRLMTLEAASLHGRPLAGMVHWLKRHPNEIRALSRHRQAIDDLSMIGITVLASTAQLVSLAADVTSQEGLLMNDALIIVTMRDYGLAVLASNDADFDNVSGITRYAPI